MAKISKEKIRQFIKDSNLKSSEDVQPALKDLFASTLQEILEAELETHLGYAKHDIKNKKTDNSRTGHSRKTLTSEYGDVEISVPTRPVMPQQMLSLARFLRNQRSELKNHEVYP